MVMCDLGSIWLAVELLNSIKQRKEGDSASEHGKLAATFQLRYAARKPEASRYGDDVLMCLTARTRLSHLGISIPS